MRIYFHDFAASQLPGIDKKVVAEPGCARLKEVTSSVGMLRIPTGFERF